MKGINKMKYELIYNIQCALSQLKAVIHNGEYITRLSPWRDNIVRISYVDHSVYFINIDDLDSSQFVIK